MTFEEIGAKVEAIAEELGIGFGYAPFKHGQRPKLPYLAFSYPGKKKFACDNGPYIQISRIYVGLITEAKDIDLEEAVEAKLQETGIQFTMDSDSDYYEDIDAFVASYETEELINGNC